MWKPTTEFGKIQRRIEIKNCTKKKNLLDEWEQNKFGDGLPDTFVRLTSNFDDIKEYRVQ